MISMISGVVVAGAGGAGLWYFMPHHGKVNPLVNTALLDSLIPICIVTAFAIGCALIVAGVMN